MSAGKAKAASALSRLPSKAPDRLEVLLAQAVPPAPVDLAASLHSHPSRPSTARSGPSSARSHAEGEGDGEHVAAFFMAGRPPVGGSQKKKKSAHERVEAILAAGFEPAPTSLAFRSTGGEEGGEEAKGAEGEQSAEEAAARLQAAFEIQRRQAAAAGRSAAEAAAAEAAAQEKAAAAAARKRAAQPSKQAFDLFQTSSLVQDTFAVRLLIIVNVRLKHTPLPPPNSTTPPSLAAT